MSAAAPAAAPAPAAPAAPKPKPSINVHGAAVEFAGTLAIAFITALIGGNSGRMASGMSVFGIDPLGPFMIGFAYMAMTYAFGHLSGAYFNPALTLLGKLLHRLEAVDMVVFLVAQFAGAFAGVALATGLITESLHNAVGYGFTEAEAIFVEVVFAAFLFHVYVLTVAKKPQKIAVKNSWFGMSVGFTFIGVSSAAANISGGVFNPAVGLALQVVHDDGNLWYIYTFAPFVAVFATFVVQAFTATRIATTTRPYFHFGGAMLFEFFHTGALVAVTALVSRSYRAGGVASSPVITNPWAPLVIGLFYGAQMYAGYVISGGHLNPAISLSVYLTQKRILAKNSVGPDTIRDGKLCYFWKLLAYWTAQIVGGIVGGLVAVRMHATDAYAAAVDEFIPAPGAWEKGQEFVFEIAFVTLLCFVYLCCARTREVKGNSYYGFAFALAWIASALAYGKPAISLNPATGVGLILSADADGVTDAGRKSWIYVLGPLIAGCVAPLLYRITNEPEFVPEPLPGAASGRWFTAIKNSFNEFIGSFYFALALACANGSSTPAVTGIAAACILGAMVYACAHSSGGHHNSAVTFGVWLTNRMSWDDMVKYIASQMVGGILGAVLAKYITGKVVTLAPAALSNGDWLAFLAEFLFTFFLVYTAMSTGSSKNQAGFTHSALGSHYFGASVGFTVICGAYSIGGFSGAAMNPMITVAMMVRNGSEAVLDKLWLYLLAEFLGAAAAAAVFVVNFEQDVRGVASRHFDAIHHVVAEFVGTFFIFLVTSLTLGQVNSGQLSGPSTFFAFLAIAAVYMITTNQARGVSGSHFNPAVTVCLVAANLTDFSIGKLFSYIGAQILGAIAGGLVAKTFTGTAFAPWVTDNDDSFRALIAEMIATAIICTVVLNTMHTRAQRGNSFFGIAIGFTYAACTASIFFLSRAGLNPAATGLVVVNGGVPVADDLYIYWVGPLLGALLAAGLFWFTSARSPAKQDST